MDRPLYGRSTRSPVSQAFERNQETAGLPSARGIRMLPAAYP